jgi:tRNA pseudouridine13 synthase
LVLQEQKLWTKSLEISNYYRGIFVKDGHPFEKPFGMDFYSTESVGIGGKLKTRYEDFLVEEIASDKSVITFKGWQETPIKEPAIVGKKARFVTFTVQKMGISTMDVSTILSSSLKLPRNLVTYAGLKDKRAITVQQMSVPSRALPDFANLEHSRINLRDFFYSRHPIQIGDLWGNRFTILLRNIDADSETALTVAEVVRETPLLNYFGVQRFGLNRPNTHFIGKYLIKRDFENAIRTMLCTDSSFESEGLRAVRLQLAEEFIPTEKMIEVFPKDLNYERTLLYELIKHPHEYERALQRVSPRILTLMVHAYQSFLFNRMLGQRAAAGLSIVKPQPGDFLIELDTAHSGRDSWLFVTERSLEERIEQVERGEYGLALPVPGYATRLPPALQTDALKSLLKNEGIALRDFRSSKIKALDSSGGFHLAAIIIDDLTASCSEEGLRVAFSLRKGSYATVVLRELMKNDPINRV